MTFGCSIIEIGNGKVQRIVFKSPKNDGTCIGVDPYNHLTIPSVAFEGTLEIFSPGKNIDYSSLTFPRQSLVQKYIVDGICDG